MKKLRGTSLYPVISKTASSSREAGEGWIDLQIAEVFTLGLKPLCNPDHDGKVPLKIFFGDLQVLLGKVRIKILQGRRLWWFADHPGRLQEGPNKTIAEGFRQRLAKLERQTEFREQCSVNALLKRSKFEGCSDEVHHSYTRSGLRPR